MTTKNTTVSLSNEFIQQPQKPFTAVETKLFHFTLLQLHQKEKVFKPLYTVDVSDIITKQGSNYALLSEAITSLKSREWFGVPLFLELRHVKGESVIEFILNPLLSKHLLGLKEIGWFATIDVAALYERGLKNPVAWRLLWILRSYWRPKAKDHKKILTIAELHSMFFANDVPFDGFTRLKQHIGCAEKALVAAGVQVYMKSDKRGLIAKGLKFIVPDLKLKTKRKLKDAIESVVETVSETVTQVVAEVAKVAVMAPVAATLAVAPVVAEAAPTLSTRTTVTGSTSMGNIGSLMNQVLDTASTGRASTPTPQVQPANTLVVTGSQLNLASRVQLAREKMNRYKLADWQIEIFVSALRRNLALEKAFFSTLYKVQQAIETPGEKAIDNKAGYIVRQMEAALSVQCRKC